MSIQENIAEIRRRIAVACAECGRDPKEITLVGASKMNDAAACREAIAAGIDVLGENRVQEMTEKLAQGAYEGAPSTSSAIFSATRSSRWSARRR